jgi:HlyD family secretion protein
VVISRDVDPGQTVAASLQTPKLFAIANDLQHMQVEASVDEADIGQISAGQSVGFTVDAYADEQFHGSVTQVRLSPVTVQNVVTYTVIIEVPNPDMKLRPGMTATVSILVNKREDVLRIPMLALRFQPPQEYLDKVQKADSPSDAKPDSSRRSGGTDRMKWRQGGPGDSPSGAARENRPEKKTARIWVLDADKRLKPVVVQIGLNDNRYVELLGNDLKEGDDVVIGIQSTETASSSNSQTNPFQPRPMGGGGGGGRGRM